MQTADTTAASEKTQQSPRLHLDYLDGVRAAAALFVVMSHVAGMVWRKGMEPKGWEARVIQLSEINHWSVCVFIVLSGFCLMLPVVKSGWTLRGGAKRFFLRRARRILPPYYFAMGLSLLLIWTVLGEKTGTPWDTSLSVTPRSILTHLLLIHNLFRNENNPILNDYAQINYPFWSVAVEWQIYFTFPLLVWMWRRIGGLAATALTTLFAYALVFLLRGSPLIGLTPQFLALFALGMLGAAASFSVEPFWQRVRERFPWTWAVICALGVVLLLHNIQNKRILDFFVGLATVCALVRMARPGPNGARAFFESRPLVAVGRFSYSLYLIHAPLLQVLWLIGFHLLRLLGLDRAPGRTLGEWLLFELVGVPLIVGASYLFFLVCERPFLNTPPRGEKSPSQSPETAEVRPAAAPGAAS